MTCHADASVVSPYTCSLFLLAADRIRACLLSRVLGDVYQWPALGREGFVSAYGARPLRRLIRGRVEDPIAEGILAGDFHAGDRLLLSEGEGGVVAAKAAP